MGNKIDGYRWRFDATTSDAEETILSGSHRILGIFWVEGKGSGQDIAADDDLVINDGDGNLIYEETAAGTPATASNAVRLVIPNPGLPVVGFSVKELDGGILIVWTAEPYT